MRRENAIHGALGESKAERTAIGMDVGIMIVSQAGHTERESGWMDQDRVSWGQKMALISHCLQIPPAAALI